VMCSNDMTALGVMRHAYERRISVPTNSRSSASMTSGWRDSSSHRSQAFACRKPKRDDLLSKALLTEVEGSPPLSRNRIHVGTDLVPSPVDVRSLTSLR
jgi:hypothetical protein